MSSGDKRRRSLAGPRLYPRSNQSAHFFSDVEKVAFTSFVNNALQGDPDLESVLPIDKNDVECLCNAVKCSLVLPKLLNVFVPGAVPPSSLRKNVFSERSHFDRIENQQRYITAARKLKCVQSSIGHGDLTDAHPHIVMAVLDQLISGGYTQLCESYKERLKKEGRCEMECVSSQLEGYEFLLAWANEMLSPFSMSLKNLVTDLGDGKSLLALAAAVEAAEQKENGESVLEDVLKEISDKSVGSSCIQEVLRRLERIGCDAFASEESIAEGNKKLNVFMLNSLFVRYATSICEEDDSTRGTHNESSKVNRRKTQPSERMTLVTTADLGVAPTPPLDRPRVSQLASPTPSPATSSEDLLVGEAESDSGGSAASPPVGRKVSLVDPAPSDSASGSKSDSGSSSQLVKCTDGALKRTRSKGGSRRKSRTSSASSSWSVPPDVVVEMERLVGVASTLRKEVNDLRELVTAPLDTNKAVARLQDDNARLNDRIRLLQDQLHEEKRKTQSVRRKNKSMKKMLDETMQANYELQQAMEEAERGSSPSAKHGIMPALKDFAERGFRKKSLGDDR